MDITTRNAEIAKMRPLDTQEIIPGVYAVRDEHVNLYVVRCDRGFIAVDSGMDKARVAAGLSQVGIAPADVSAVFITHTHRDHIGGLGLFENAQVYIGKDEEQMLSGQTMQTPVLVDPPLQRRALLADGQRVEAAGCTVTAVAAPGHTTGSTAYLVGPGYLFTGDALRLNNGKTEVFNEFFNMDTPRLRESLAALAKIPDVIYVFSAHYGYVKGGVTE